MVWKCVVNNVITVNFYSAHRIVYYHVCKLLCAEEFQSDKVIR